jgi:23S rRNA (guanosine2251-2'-O)-methyltransferase
MIIVLNNIRSSWNVGSVLRTADALGAKVICVGYTPRPVGATLKMVAKTAIGAENNVESSWYENEDEVFSDYDNDKYLHIAVDITGWSVDMFEYLRSTKRDQREVLLWFGNEISGLEHELCMKCAATLHLPMNGQKESLNIASSVAVAGYFYKYLPI